MVEHIVVYQIGGTYNFQWRVVFEIFTSEEKMQDKIDSLMISGYPAKAITLADYNQKGVPNTYEGGWK